MVNLLLAAILAVQSYFFGPPDIRPQIVHAQQLDAGDLWIQRLGDTCESMGKTTSKVLDVNDRYSYGWLQFQMATWLRYSKRFGTTPENIYDKALQWKVARYILDNGGQSNWYNCSKLLKKTMGDYPTQDER